MNSCQRSIVNYKKRITGYTPLKTGVDNTVYAIRAFDPSNVYIGGKFTSVGGNSTIQYITMWNGSSYTALNALGTGVNQTVYAIHALDPSNVYIGGGFSAAGGNTNCKCITRWDGTKFNALKTGVNSTVNAIHALDPSNVYIGGGFINMFFTYADYIVKWNGSSYVSLIGANGGGVIGGVNGIYANVSQVYIGGSFTNICMPNGTSYLALGGGTFQGGYVNAIYGLDQEHIYIGGTFTSISVNSTINSTIKYITMWNGTSYIALGTGITGGTTRVNAIYALDPQHVYIGGIFTSAGGNSTIQNITMWNGTSYIALGAGVDRDVNAIYALDPQHVYIGGLFTSAGGNSANKYVTMWSGE